MLQFVTYDKLEIVNRIRNKESISFIINQDKCSHFEADSDVVEA